MIRWQRSIDNELELAGPGSKPISDHDADRSCHLLKISIKIFITAKNKEVFAQACLSLCSIVHTTWNYLGLGHTCALIDTCGLDNTLVGWDKDP